MGSEELDASREEDLDEMMSAYWAKGKPDVAAKHLDSAMDEYFAKKKDTEKTEEEGKDEGEKGEEEKKE